MNRLSQASSLDLYPIEFHAKLTHESRAGRGYVIIWHMPPSSVCSATHYSDSDVGSPSSVLASDAFSSGELFEEETVLTVLVVGMNSGAASEKLKAEFAIGVECGLAASGTSTKA